MSDYLLIKAVVDGVFHFDLVNKVSVDFFETTEDRVIWRLLQDWWRRKGHAVKDWDALYQLVLNEPGVENRARVLERVEWLKGLDAVKDWDVAREMLWDLYREKVILKLMKEMEVELANGKKVDVVVDRLRGAILQVGNNIFEEERAKSVFDGVYDRLVYVSEKGFEEGLLSGIPSLDVLLYGGFRQGSLVVWLGATSVGKTMMLVWQSVMAMLQGKRVLFLTLEDDEATILNRFDRALFYVCRDDFSRVQGRIELLRSVGGSVDVMFVPRMSVAELEMEYERRKGEVDVLVVDYGDLVGSERKRVEDWLEQGEVFERLMGLARKEGIWVITASQASRQALDAKVITLGHVGRSFRKVQVAQYVLALVQTKEEEEKGLMRVVLLKNKFGPRGHQVVVRVLREYNWFREEV